MNAETLSEQEIEARFTYHKPIGNQPQRYERIRAKAKELALLIRNACPSSRERSTALTNLQSAIMWANAAIAINENESTSTVVWEEMTEEQAELERQIVAWKLLSPEERFARIGREEKV